MDSSSFDFLSQSMDRKVRKILGRSYLYENRVEDAVDIYLLLHHDYPDDSDVNMIFAELYHLSGSPETAKRLYRAVLEHDPKNRLAEKQMACRWEETGSGVEELAPFSPDAVQRLVVRLQGLQPAQQQKVRWAADLFENPISEDGTLAPGSSKNEDMQHLMPALVDLNIRQARASGQLDLAEALQSLQIQLARHSGEDESVIDFGENA